MLAKFGEPFLRLLQVSLCLFFKPGVCSHTLQNTDHAITQSQDKPDALRAHFTTLNFVTKIFYDLSCQDLPPVFEENLAPITSVLHKYLIYDNAALHSKDSDESGILEEVKVGIFEALILYIQKFEDVFGPLLAPFVNSSWNLLTTTGTEAKYDILVSRALQFLTAVTRIQKHAQSFNNEGVLGQVVENVILPNMTLRESDMELFEDEPIDFIRRDLEGADSDTRRRAATDFLRQLVTHFEKLVTEVVWKYIRHYISEYSADQARNWKSKDTAVYLFSSIAAKGVTTVGQGVKSTNT